MSQNTRTHLRGQRGQAFADQIRGLPPEHILCVSLDIHKYFHVVMLHNALGELVMPTFEIDIFQSGFDKLCQSIDDVKAKTQAQIVLLGMEPSSHYFENLARHLLARKQPVTLINSFAVKHNRDQHMMQREKDDEIDTAAIGDLLRRGEGSPYQPATGVYLKLQQLDRVRLGQVRIRAIVQNHILGHLDRICPGLVLLGDEALKRYTPLFTKDFWLCQTLQHLIRVCPDPRRLAALSPEELRAAFHARGYRLAVTMARKLIDYAQKILLPEPELIAIRSELLQRDLALLETLDAQIADLDQRLTALVADTPYAIWTKLKGLAPVQVASLAGAIGDPKHYDHAGQVFRRAGLVPGRHDSGVQQHLGQGKHILKVGDVYLRRALMNGVASLLLHQPCLSTYYERLQLTKPKGVARVATARRALGILWATLRDQKPRTLGLKQGVQL